MRLLSKTFWPITLITFLTVQCQLSYSTARFFRGRDPSIIQEVVYVLSNSSSYKQDKTSKVVEYLKNIFFLPESPAPPPEGLQGILYSQDDPCDGSSFTSNAPINVSHIKHIALLSLNECTIDWKINRAQNDLAVGAIIYDDQPIRIESLTLSTSIAIPVVVVSSEVGRRLYSSLIEVDTATTPINTTSHWKKYISLQILPYQKFRPGVWELTFIIGLILVVSSVLVFVVVRCHRRWSQNHLTRHHDMPRKSEIAVLERSHLDNFPVRQWNYDETSAHPKETPHIGGVQSPHLGATGIENQSRSMDPSCNLVNQHHSASQTPLLHKFAPPDEPIHPVCSVCLDDFCAGDLVKRLPCQHDFHLRCIDIWLTTKCNQCPLCKARAVEDIGLRGVSTSLESRPACASTKPLGWLPFKGRQ